MKKAIAVLSIFNLCASIFCQELTAKKIAENAVKIDSPQAAEQYASSEAEKLTIPAEKRAAFTFLGSLQESLSEYEKAQRSFAKAAGISAGTTTAEGMPKKSSERLVLDAVRCALSAGDWENAENYLNSAVRNSKNPEIQATIKLYEQWAKLCKAETSSDLEEPTAMLKTYINLDSMKSVKHSILLTLWYITADSSYAELLNKEYPSSMEAGIVNGKIQIYPAPFWYFLPRKTAATPEISSEKEDLQEETNKNEQQNSKTSAQAASPESEKTKHFQLGLFRDKTNAENFVKRVKEKGFNAYIQEEKRSSGTTYFIVVVDENSEETMGIKLKNAGFECYPN